MDNPIENKKNNIWKIVSILLIFIVLMGIGYVLGSKQLDNYVIQKQVQAANETAQYVMGSIVNTIISDIQTKGYTTITIGNQSLILVPYTETEQQK